MITKKTDNMPSKPVLGYQNVVLFPEDVTSASDRVPQTSDHVKHNDIHGKAWLWFECGQMYHVSI